MKNIIVVGHKNPDTDSICSAIAYANLKNKIDSTNSYKPYRAGHINEETQHVLKKCNVKAPELIQDLRMQVRDMDIKRVQGTESSISLKKAWNLMKQIGVVTLPVTDDRKLVGIITITDIATSYMDIHDTKLLAVSNTTFKQIAETLDGKIVCANEKKPIAEGKVFTAIASPEKLETYIEENDVVIVGNRYESQLCAIEMGAGCIIVCEGAPISITISHLANEHGCTVISSPHDAFTVSRLIFQSIPVKFVMRSEGLLTFRTDDFIDDVKQVMAQKRHRDFPVLDRQDNYIGMISRRSLLGAEKKKVIMVDHNEAKQAVNGIETADILEIIDHHRLGSIETISPVYFRNQPVGCTSTIVNKLYEENGVEIDETMAALMCSAILSDTLMFRSPTCTSVDEKAARKLAKIAGIDIESYATAMFRAGSELSTKSSKDILYQDYKRFSMGDVTFGIGQVSSMDNEELDAIKKKVTAYMKEHFDSMGVNMLFLMLTNIMKSSTELICLGDGAEELVESAFGVKGENGNYLLEGVVSRKKQLVPELMMAVAQ